MIRHLAFPRTARLLGQSDFEQTFKSGKRVRATQHISVTFRSLQEADAARLGLAVSKRAIAHATDRNRFKRLCRESFRHARPSLPAVDIIVGARASARSLSNDQLRAEFDCAWSVIRKMGGSRHD